MDYKVPDLSFDRSPPLPSPSPPLRWWSEDTVAVVTGANKGIGFALVKRLAELGLTVILTARDSAKGLEAVESLRGLGLGRRVHFCPLDVSEPASIESFVSWFRKRFGTLDILVNNAAASFNEVDDDENSVEHAEIVIKTNFIGAKLLTDSFLPMFRLSNSVGRILNISSRLGSINKVKNPKIKSILQNENLSVDQIEAVVNLFLEQVKNGTWKGQGWPEIWTEYAVSKLALNAYSRVLARRYQGTSCRRLSVNCFCPGYTQTSMTRGKGTHTAEAAADVAVQLALLPPENLPTGKFYLGCTPLINSRL